MTAVQGLIGHYAPRPSTPQQAASSSGFDEVLGGELTHHTDIASGDASDSLDVSGTESSPKDAPREHEHTGESLEPGERVEGDMGDSSLLPVSPLHRVREETSLADSVLVTGLADTTPTEKTSTAQVPDRGTAQGPTLLSAQSTTLNESESTAVPVAGCAGEAVGYPNEIQRAVDANPAHTGSQGLGFNSYLLGTLWQAVAQPEGELPRAAALSPASDLGAGQPVANLDALPAASTTLAQGAATLTAVGPASGDQTTTVPAAATVLATEGTVTTSQGPTQSETALVAAQSSKIIGPSGAATEVASPCVAQVLATHGESFTAQLRGPLLTLRSASAGEHTLTVSVTPENLGPVNIKAHVSASGLRIELVGATDLVRDALRAILPELKRDVAGAGLPTQLTVSHSSSSGQGTSNGSTEFAQNSQDQPQGKEAPNGQRSRYSHTEGPHHVPEHTATKNHTPSPDRHVDYLA
ncbi:flagellar hook-length control protein FliK [Timonella senegalensis]|uniref:flagellar hook-length control protein FliK n=1 Tax=Timonella senegalensis TaxID=1465825 RepID=UPI00031881C2|nr:flagellar hook-length control protein FliK [Timonella senegalensis]